MVDLAATATRRASVIVPVYNAQATLAACLSSLCQEIAQLPTRATPENVLAVGESAERLDEVEVILVDNGSTDESLTIAAQFPVKVLRWPDRSGPAFARNMGAQLAQGAILVFVDADVQLLPGALARLLTGLEGHPGVAAVFGSYDDDPLAPNIVSRFRNLLHHYMHQIGRAESASFWAGFGAIRAEVFRALGGYDLRYDDASIEDVDLGMRMSAAGHSIRLLPGCQVKHAKQWSLASMIYTDFWCRGVPWTHMMIRAGQMAADLNLGWWQRVSALLVVMACGALLAAAIQGWASLLLLLVVAGTIVLGDRWTLAWSPATLRSHAWKTAVQGILVTAGTISLAVLVGRQQPILFGVAATACGLLLGINAGLYRLMLRRLGVWQLLPALWLHMIYFLNAGLALVWGTWTYRPRSAATVLPVSAGGTRSSMNDVGESLNRITTHPAFGEPQTLAVKNEPD